MKRLGVWQSALCWVALLMLVIAGGRSALAQGFYRGEITSYSPTEYLAGATRTAGLKIQNTGVSGYFAARVIEVPSGWTVTPTQTSAVIVGSNKSHTFNFQVTPPQQADFQDRTIKFRLLGYENDEFEFKADEDMFTIRAITTPGDFELFAPADGVFNLEQPITFVWDAAANALTYRIEFYENNFGVPKSTPFLTRAGLTSTNYTLTTSDVALAPGVDYHWRVFAVNNAGSKESFLGSRVFRTKPLPAVGAFSFITPAEDDLRLSVRPSFSWTTAANATLYYLEVYRDVNGVVTPPAVLAVEMAATSYAWQPANSLAPGKYHVLVSAFNSNGGKQVEGGTRPFTATALTSFTQEVPAAGATGVAEKPAFQWTKSTNASGYRFELSLVSATGLVPVETRNISGSAISYQYNEVPLMRGATYEWKVTALGTGEERPSENGARRFTVQALRTFSVVAPVANDEQIAQNPLFKWQPAQNATNYSVELVPALNGQPDIANPILAAELDTGNTSALLYSQTLQANKDYYFRVAAKAGSSTEYNREGWVPFKTTTLGGFNLLTPANGAQNVTLVPQLTWQPVANAESYRVYVRPDGLGALLIFDVPATQPAATLTDAKLNGLTNYAWTVEAISQNETKFASQVFTFKTSGKITATRSDVLDAILGKQILSESERAAAGIPNGRNIDVSLISPVP